MHTVTRRSLGFYSGALLASSFLPARVFGLEPLKIGTVPGPIAEILQFAVGRAKDQSMDVRAVEFSDWVTPNEALQSGDIDANLFQHIPFLEAAREGRKYDFVPLAPTFSIPSGLYSKRIKRFDEVRPESTAAIASDPVNGSRGLHLFERAGLIKLKSSAGDRATVNDIVENPKKLHFLEIEAPLLPRVLDDVELAQVSITYFMASGGNPEELLISDGYGDTRYALQFVARADRKDDPRLLRFIDVYRSPETRDFIKNRYGKFLVPAF